MTEPMTDAEVARFWSRVDKTDGCWVWRGSTSGRGVRYGALRRNGVTKRAHRVAWEIASGATIPDGMLVCHRCDFGLCVRPSHLFLGTHQDNMRDAAAKGRNNTAGNSAKTECKRGHPLSGDNLFIRSNGSRECRTCISAYIQKRNARRKGRRKGIEPPGHSWADRATCIYGHAYTADNTRHLSNGKRLCLTCYRNRNRQRYSPGRPRSGGALPDLPIPPATTAAQED